ncbi:type II toxin-antitoxin system VapC family toxin [Methylopila turkensis]|uniref:Ribonuclease VapC n=1 Tax=Methylopila turkensis TaxID=1437816 RepID=A0A9W6JL29_9HYPH|nr:type II toxin-antitoxin system VapC family toxin [Methylopila turkensis]GLK79072.1 hypothetical protein GCM10008174_08130 [Methylopila turkensis]
MTVVDASVAIKWFVEEPNSDAAREVLLTGGFLSAPMHVMAEVARGLLRRRRAGDLSSEDAKTVLARLPAMVALAPMQDPAPLAFDIADRAHVTIYDAFYVALADRQDDVLITADRRLCEGIAATPWEGRIQHLLERASPRGSIQDK